MTNESLKNVLLQRDILLKRQSVLTVITLSFTLDIVMLNGVIPSVVILIVVAPKKSVGRNSETKGSPISA
jgi:hypothetical protein